MTVLGLSAVRQDVRAPELALPSFRLARPFSLTHGVIPALLYCVPMLAIVADDLDFSIARGWAYAAGTGWLGDGRWWANGLIHSGGHALVWLIGLCALSAWMASFASVSWRPRRRGALYIVLAIALATGLVGLLKTQTNIDCPWSLQEFGGSNPYVSLLGERPDYLPPAACFPGAHSSSGFALMAFYFLLRDRRRRAARWALAGSILLGMVFAFGQEARGAHFLSHDLTSAAIAWYVVLALYALVLRPERLRTFRTDQAS